MDATQSMGANTAELQNDLLRMCVLCATSLEGIHPSYAPQETVEKEALTLDGAALSTQIYRDLLTILQATQKNVTGLSIAMRPAKNAGFYESPLSSLDAESVAAAGALLKTMATENVPQLSFIANLAQKHQRVYALTEEAARDMTTEEARKLGATVVYGSKAKGPVNLGASLSRVYGREVRKAAEEIVLLIAQLCQSFMDVRTRSVLGKAQTKRSGATQGAMPAPTREASLALTQQISNACDGFAGSGKGQDAYITRIPKDKKEAMLKQWKQAQVMLDDGRSELRDALEEEDDDGVMDAGLDSSNAFEDMAALIPAELHPFAVAVSKLLVHGDAAQKAARSALGKGTEPLDYDAVNDSLGALVEQQDELVASILYGEDAQEDEADENGTLAHSVLAYVASCDQLLDTVHAPNTVRCDARAPLASAQREALACIEDTLINKE
ncbi:kynureninase [Malassezia vespertilionis]|nr:kynureninase [Malassezia vespertilionis]WFD07581.1 kynureninase [Malassezia vespertilionis]